MQSLKWTLKKRDSGVYQAYHGASLSSGDLGSCVKLEEMQDWNAIVDSSADKASTLKVNVICTPLSIFVLYIFH